MRKNDISIESDGKNVYITYFVNGHIAGLILIGFFNLVFITLDVFIASQIGPGSENNLVIPFLFFTAFIVFWPLKYFLWNAFGKEMVIVNSKSVSYSRSYGLITTKMNSTVYSELGYEIELIGRKFNEEIGNIVFTDADIKTGVPKEIFTTSVPVELFKQKEAINEIEKVLIINQIDRFKNNDLFE
jgi:hypothetical protein